VAGQRTNFYESLIKDDYYEEKTAFENNQATESMLDAFSTDELEALASELKIAYEKNASSPATIEEKIAEDTQVDEEKRKEELAQQNAAKVADPGEGEKADERVDATDSEQAEEAKTKEEKEEIVDPRAKEVEEEVDDSSNEEESVMASEYEHDDLVKVAYEVVEEKLAEEGYSLLDYVYTKLPDEKIASFVADKSEKLAYLSGRNSLQVADDILMNLSDIVAGYGE
jgi:hypothetical protein